MHVPTSCASSIATRRRTTSAQVASTAPTARATSAMFHTGSQPAWMMSVAPPSVSRSSRLPNRPAKLQAHGADRQPTVPAEESCVQRDEHHTQAGQRQPQPQTLAETESAAGLPVRTIQTGPPAWSRSQVLMTVPSAWRKLRTDKGLEDFVQGEHGDGHSGGSNEERLHAAVKELIVSAFWA